MEDSFLDLMWYRIVVRRTRSLEINECISVVLYLCGASLFLISRIGLYIDDSLGVVEDLFTSFL